MALKKATKDFSVSQQKIYESGWLVKQTITTQKGSTDAVISKILLDTSAFEDKDAEYRDLISSGSLNLINSSS
jgi:hypothetical protein